MKRIIIIGGMGPQASLELHRRIIERAANNGARNGSDFPHIVHFSLPVDDFISDTRKTEKAFRLIVRSLKGFTFQNDDTTMIACNTAHLLKDRLETALQITLTSLIELTVEFIAKNHQKVQLLASPTTIQTGLYTSALAERGVEVLLPSKKQLKHIETTIRMVIASEIPRPFEESEIPTLLGCTELSCAFGESAGVIDPMNILIDTILPRKEML